MSGSPVGDAQLLIKWARRRWRDLAGVGSVFAMACAYLSPALKDGGRFGSFDFVIPLTSLGKGAYPTPAFNHLNSDVVSQMNAWNLFDWTQIHAGHFPLWNDLSLLGLPQFLNFESAVLSLPDLVSYAVPLRFAFLVAVLVKLLIAGTGAYVLARVLGLRPLGASFAGISFMLSGAFANWLSWPLTDVVGWIGWIAAFAILAYRRHGRFGYILGLAASVAFCLYGGFPEANVFVAVSIAVMAVVFVAASAVAAVARRRSRPPDGQASAPGGFSLAGLWRATGGAVIGVLLALPLWWPGLQALQFAHRKTEGGFPGLPARSLSLLVAAGYYGLPTQVVDVKTSTRADVFFLTGWNYYETVSYVGVIMLVLAAVAVVKWWRHPTVVSLAALCVVVLVAAYQMKSFHPVQQFLNTVASQVQWERFRSVLGLPLGLLGGLGLETVLRRWRSRLAFAAFVTATALMVVVVAVLASRPVAGAAQSSVRDRSLIWPAVLVGFCVICAVAWASALVLEARGGSRPSVQRWHQHLAPAVMAGGLWVASAGFLLFAGVGVNAYSHTLYPVTPAIAELQHYVGSHLVGLDDGELNRSAAVRACRSVPGGERRLRPGRVRRPRPHFAAAVLLDAGARHGRGRARLHGAQHRHRGSCPLVRDALRACSSRAAARGRGPVPGRHSRGAVVPRGRCGQVHLVERGHGVPSAPPVTDRVRLGDEDGARLDGRDPHRQGDRPTRMARINRRQAVTASRGERRHVVPCRARRQSRGAESGTGLTA